MVSVALTLLAHAMLLSLHLSNGSFPRPLSAKEERACVARMIEGDMDARNTLIEHNLRLVAHVVKKYYTRTEEQDDLVSIGTIGLIKGISSYRPEKGTRLATYAAKCIENAILSQRNRPAVEAGLLVCYVLLLRFQMLHRCVHQFQLLLRGAGQFLDRFQRLLGLELRQLPPKLLLCLF